MKTILKNLFGWLWALCLVLLGLGVNSFPGYSFSALVLWGLAAVVCCYQLLKMMAKKFPKTAKLLRRTLTVCLCIGMVAALITGCFVFRGCLGDAEQDCDYVIVLGAGVNGTVPSLSLRERINGAYDYLVKHPDAVCVVSGGQGNNELISEAQCMFNELTRMGIGEDRIWMEDQSTSTRENLRFSLALIQERTGVKPARIGLVSSEYHLFRAGLMAGDEGVTALGIPARTSWISLRINYFLREIVAVWAYWVFGG
jgi:uncharacterized SAM-binding protein YcdF (DUF218 family)